MLTQDQANLFATHYHTSQDNILKEHYQLYLLDLLFKSAWEEYLVFKGGTALRLAYSSVRFSEDLDFSLSGDVDYFDFSNTLKQIENILPEARIKEIVNKRFIYYAKIMFTISDRTIPIGIKIEVSKVKRDFESTIRLITSPFNNLEILGRVYTLESILADKLRILDQQERREPRDLYDAWYISQKLDYPFTVKDEYKYERKELMDRLNAFLPQNDRKVIELFSR